MEVCVGVAMMPVVTTVQLWKHLLLHIPVLEIKQGDGETEHR
jgi:uncharacterized protein (DUF983 family)